MVRPIGNERYEVLAGNQRLRVLRELDVDSVHCVVVGLDDADARLLAQALNRIHGDDDLGLRPARIYPGRILGGEQKLP